MSEPGAEARRYGRTASLLSIGVGATGLVTYLYFVLASHNLSREEYGEIAVLWSVVFITISTIYRPVEQLLSRTIAERTEHGAPLGEPLRVAAIIQGSLSILFALLILLLREPLEDDLLSGNSDLYWVLLVAIVAYGASYFARGFLAGSRQLPLYALLMLSESISRTACALFVAVGIFEGQSAVALGIAVAPVLSLVVVPFAFIRSTRPEPATGTPGGDAEEVPADRGARDFTFAHGGGFAAAVLLIMLSEQTFLNAGVLIVRGAEGAAAAGFIFNVLMIARAPLQLFQAVSTSLLPHLTELRTRGGAGDEEAFRASIRVTVVAIAAFAGLVGLAMLIAGPTLMEIAFGKKFEYDRAGLLIVTAGMGLYLTAATLNQAALAQGQVRRAAVCWLSCAAGFVVWTLLPLIEDEFRRVEIGFALAAAILCALLYLLYRSPHPRAEDRVEPGSGQEIEAQIAAADEAG